MSKKKLIVSILLLLSLVAICIIVPLSRKKNVTTEPETATETKPLEEAASESEVETEVPLLDLDFSGFEDLADFFTDEQLADLKEQLTYYISANHPKVTAVTFLPKEVSYPNTTSLKMGFQISDKDILTVYYNLKSDVFSFTDEQTIVKTKEDMKYEKETDYNLPNYTAEEIEEMQEGGYPDTETTTESEVQP